MRIAINTRFLLPDGLEGLGRYTHEICRRLVARYPEHDYLFLFDRPYEQCYIYGASVEGQVVSPPARHPLLWYLWFEWAVPQALAAWKADVFFSPDGYCSLRSRVPTLMSMHDIGHHHFPEQTPWLVRHYYNHFVPRYAARADRITAVSDFTRRDVVEAYGIAAEKTFVATNAGRDIFEPLAQNAIQEVRAAYADGQPYFLYLGAIHPRKNVHQLIAAFDQFVAETGAPVRLLLAGRWAWQAGAVKSAYESARHQDQIKFLGFVDNDALARLMGGSLALCLLSTFEGFGLPLVEAMQARVPILCSDRSALPEVAGSAGLIVAPDKLHEISNAMQALWEDTDLQQRLITAGQQELSRFSWDSSADKIMAALEALGTK